MKPSLVTRLLSALSTREGAVLATPLVLGIAAATTFFASPVPAGEPVRPLVLAQATAGAPAAAATGSFSAAQKSEIEAIIKDYLVNHPEILVEASKELEKRQTSMQAENAKRVIMEQKTALFRAPLDFVAGNPKGDVTVIEFFDYNCGWCKKAIDEVQKLTKADPQVRVVFKEFPIFGENSATAARAAIASQKQGKYWDFHVALMREKQVTKDNLFKIAEKVGINVEKLKADMADPAIEAAIKQTTALAQELGIEGTPGFIVDNRVNVGFVPAEGIREILGDVRKAGCQVC